MAFLLDTHLLLWAASDPRRLTPESQALLGNPATKLIFSTASIWEVVIKNALAVDLLPPIHNDPFDRILIAQAQVENLTLLTTDNKVIRYPGPIQALK